MAKVLRWFAYVLLFSLVISGTEQMPTKTKTDHPPTTVVLTDESEETTAVNEKASEASVEVTTITNSENITTTTSDIEREENNAASPVSVPTSTKLNKASPSPISKPQKGNGIKPSLDTPNTTNASTTTPSVANPNTTNASTTTPSVANPNTTKASTTTPSLVTPNTTKASTTTPSLVTPNPKKASTTTPSLVTPNTTTASTSTTKPSNVKPNTTNASTTKSPIPTKTTVKQEDNARTSLPISQDSENNDSNNEDINDVNDQSRRPSENAGINTGLSSLNPESEPEGHFMAYFLTAVVLCVAGYVIFHNKQKIVAFIVEGRTGRKSSRRPSKGGYRKLKPSADDLMPSLEKSTTSTSYVY